MDTWNKNELYFVFLAFPVPRGLQSQDEDLSQRTLEEDQRSHEEDQPSLPQRAMEKKRALEKKSGKVFIYYIL